MKNFLLIIAVLALIIVPFLVKPDAPYEGADAQAETAITEIAPNYKPWFSSLFEPPSGEIESLLFSVQAAVGAGLIGYAIGFYKGRILPRKKK